MIDDGSTDATAAVARRARRDRRLVRREPRASRGDRRRVPRGARARVRVLRPGGRGRPASRRRAAHGCSSSSARITATSRSARASRRERATTPTATRRRATRRFGIGLLQKAMHVRLGRPFHDPTSGMAAVNREGDADHGAAVRERRARGGGAAAAEAGRAPRRGGRRPHARALARRVEAPGARRRSSSCSPSSARCSSSAGCATAAREPAPRRRARLLRRRPRRAPPGLRGAARARGGGRRRPTTWSCSPAGRASRHTHSEAELMRAAWRGAAREVVVDPDARTTVENMANALNDVLRVGAREVLVVTSSLARAAREGRAPLAPAPHGRAGALDGAGRAVAEGVAPRAGPVAAPAVPALGRRAQELGTVTRSPAGRRLCPDR